MASLFDAVFQFCEEQGWNKQYWLAYSGGLDSHVLLHLFVTLRQHYPVRFQAVYIHHGLSPHADDWEQHCRKICADLNVLFTSYKVHAQPQPGQSPEELARIKRYQQFSKLLAAEDYLLTAHHQDDQAETVLLQLFRGSGPQGLAAMPKIKKWKQGFHARPLLNFPRSELKKYAEDNHLKWIEDESNFNRKLTRNFLRHEVIPLLKTRWPSVNKTLARAAEHCADLVFPSSQTQQRQDLRSWLQTQNLPMPSTVKLQQIQKELLQAREDKSPRIFLGKVELRRYQNKLYALEKKPKHDVRQVLSWDLCSNLEIKHLGQLQAVITAGPGLRADIQHVTVRFRQGGESLHLPGRKHRHALKKLFQEWQVPPWQRDCVPLLYVDDQLAVVVGYAVADGFAVAKDGLDIRFP